MKKLDSMIRLSFSGKCIVGLIRWKVECDPDKYDELLSTCRLVSFVGAIVCLRWDAAFSSSPF